LALLAQRRDRARRVHEIRPSGLRDASAPHLFFEKPARIGPGLREVAGPGAKTEPLQGERGRLGIEGHDDRSRISRAIKAPPRLRGREQGMTFW